MFATSARSVPDIASAWRELPAALNWMRFSTFSTWTSGTMRWERLPSGPFTWISPGVRVTSTFCGSTTGAFPILDMARLPLRDDAQHFAADAHAARLAVGHHATGGRDDRDAEPVHHFGKLVLGAIDPQPRTAH